MKRVINATNTIAEITYANFKKKLKQYGFNVRYNSNGYGSPEIYAISKVNEESVVFVLTISDSGIPIWTGVSAPKNGFPANICL